MIGVVSRGFMCDCLAAEAVGGRGFAQTALGRIPLKCSHLIVFTFHMNWLLYRSFWFAWSADGETLQWLPVGGDDRPHCGAQQCLIHTGCSVLWGKMQPSTFPLQVGGSWGLWWIHLRETLLTIYNSCQMPLKNAAPISCAAAAADHDPCKRTA